MFPFARFGWLMTRGLIDIDGSGNQHASLDKSNGVADTCQSLPYLRLSCGMSTASYSPRINHFKAPIAVHHESMLLIREETCPLLHCIASVLKVDCVPIRGRKDRLIKLAPAGRPQHDFPTRHSSKAQFYPTRAGQSQATR